LHSSLPSLLTVYSTYSATPALSPLSLHDALPILPFTGVMVGSSHVFAGPNPQPRDICELIQNEKVTFTGAVKVTFSFWISSQMRSEEHTSELQSRVDLVCRLLLEKKKTIHNRRNR